MSDAEEIFVERLEGEKFLHYWPDIEEQLDRFPHLWQPRWTKIALREYTLEERIQCWAVGTDETIYGVTFSQVVKFPGANVFQVMIAFGNGLLEMVDALEAMFEKFALMHNCELAEITGRPGWEPQLQKLGFRKTSITLSRRLEQQRMN